MALFRQPSKGFLTSLAVLSGLAGLAAGVQPAHAQEPASCLSSNPADWPSSSRPYFMLAVDTSGSMIGCTNPTGGYQFPATCPTSAPVNSCGLIPTRLNDAKCALRQTVQAFSGEVNFGLATFATYLTGCPTGVCQQECPAGSTDCDTSPTLPGGEAYNCTYNYFTGAASNPSQSCGNFPACTVGSGTGPGTPNFAEGAWRNGGNVVVGVNKDPWWLPPPPPASNTAQLLEWFDGRCDNNREIFAKGGTPLEGILRTATQYLRAGWTQWSTANYCQTGLSYTFPTPADTNDRTCRNINVILVTDGDESCQGTPANAAQDLFQNGVTIGGKNWKVKTYVINFAGGTTANTDAIALAGGTGASYSANNAVQLANALSSIISSAVRPETCNNADDNCNGCTDEGFTHYCNDSLTTGCCTWNTLAQRTMCGANACKCCNWNNAGERTTCINQYTPTITTANPNGDQTLLPCTTSMQQTQPGSWLCYNPGDVCDEKDNNCASGIDEGQLKCGTPAKCASPEVCDGKDNDCDSSIDEGVPMCTLCVPSAEVCDGCDNDCDGIADDGIPAQACGLAAPPNCGGMQACKPPVNVPVGTCVAGGGLQACVTSPATETCDNVDNDCDGVVDDNVPPQTCELVPGLDYGPLSQCRRGTKACPFATSPCLGFVGPSTEVCDGIDNDCDGQTDEGVAGVGTQCGTATAPCTPGTLQCVGGALICQGGTQPQPERCDGIDNNCNGTVDDAPLQDGPPVGQTGCWTPGGTCAMPCTFGGLTWCAPQGATCNGTGTLSSPCSTGTLVCTMGAWSCQGPIGPSAEVCDNVDNNCDGMSDNVPGVGVACGTDVGECVAGTSQCSANGIICVGAVGPSAELCDNKDNDCDGAIDDGVPGVGQPCGVNQPPCTLGMTACQNGAVVCTGGVQPVGELCDGIDNDCDGAIDDAPLADAPPIPGCWNIPDPTGMCGCSYGGYQWCPPLGASCNDNGMLMTPCNKGTLSCNGTMGWTCSNANPPIAEACDGLDNNCDGTIDNGMFPTVGNACGSDDGECVAGTIECTAGKLDCVGDVGPTQELCNGLDDDCDNIIDNGIVIGGPCAPMYDTTLYPGMRDKGACQPGVQQCNGMGGSICVGGQGPQPEVCDGIDNDCDGAIDETGPAPDGIDGTANPFPPPTASIGELCGVDTGACQQGNYACLNGQFACVGGQGPQEEVCDCNDNDCDGTNDEQDPSPASPLCAGEGKCVKSGSSCLCATPCLPGEFPCPPGQRCEQVTSSDTGTTLGNYCVADNCGDCSKKTVLNADNTVLCAPAGTPADANCVVPPVCVCKGQPGCKNPCFGVTCGPGQICTEYGPNAGKCVANNCFTVPCQGCGQVCKNGSCTTNPCTPSTCPGQACVPNGDFTDHTCVDSCAGKSCATGEVCKAGVCVKDCSPGCPMGQTCDYGQMPPKCMPSLCSAPCANGGCCDPLTGQCGNCPCDGVVCPTGQVCMNDDCFGGTGGAGGAGGGGGNGVGGAETSSSTGSGMGGAMGASTGTGIWGLPTGGGGCSCDLGAKERSNGVSWALAALAVGIMRRRTTARRGAKEVS